MDELTQIGALLHSALREIGLMDELRRDSFLMDWTNIVGERIASYAHPVRFDDGELWLVVEDPGWRSEIFNIKEMLIERINEAIGEKAVRKIMII